MFADQSFEKTRTRKYYTGDAVTDLTLPLYTPCYRQTFPDSELIALATDFG